jgi:uncharacterized protein with PIN domain
VKFLIDSMLPPRTAELLGAAGHEAVTPAQLGAHNLPDDELIRLAIIEDRVIVTENAQDFANAACAVLLVRKSWWPAAALAQRLCTAIDLWAGANPEPGAWAHWLTPNYR